jgi:ATP phosphoribosyltransferase
MDPEILKKIAESLERIAICMENKQLREIATYKKSQAALVAEKKADNKKQAKSQPIIPVVKQTVRVRNSGK